MDVSRLVALRDRLNSAIEIFQDPAIQSLLDQGSSDLQLPDPPIPPVKKDSISLPVPVESFVSMAVPVPEPPKRRSSAGKQMGLQAEVLRSVFTGPLTQEDIGKVVPCKTVRLRETLSRMVKDQWIDMNDGKYHLTNRGQVGAKYLAQHPHRRILPSDIKQKLARTSVYAPVAARS